MADDQAKPPADDDSATPPADDAADAPQEEGKAEEPASAEASADEQAAEPSGEGDQTLSCEECGQQFTFTKGEQEFYEEKGFTPPKRCQACRQAKKEASRQLTKVTCAECGKETEVPFVPSGDRPVYCRECFETKRDQQ